MWSPTQRALSRGPLASDKITFELLVCIFISSVNLKTTVQHRLRDPLALGHSHFSPGKMQQPLRHAPLLPLLPSPQDWPPLSSQVLLSVSQIKSHPSRNRSVNSRFAGLKPKSVGSGAIRLELPLRFSAPPTSARCLWLSPQRSSAPRYARTCLRALALAAPSDPGT